MAAVIESGAYFLLNVLLARSSGREVFGDIAAAMVAANIIHAVTEGGLASYFQREAAHPDDRFPARVRSGLNLRGWSLIPFGGVFVLYIAGSGNTAPVPGGVAALMLFGAGVGQLLGRLLYGMSRYRESFRALAVGRIVSAFLAMWAYANGTGAGIVLSAFGAGVILQIGMLWKAIRGAGIVLPTGSERSMVWEILSSSVPMGIGLVFVWMYDKMDILIVRHLLDAASVSSYAVAYTVYKIPQIVTGAVLVPLFTGLSGTYAKDGVLRYTDVTRPALILTAAAAISMSALWWGSEWFIRMVYGEPYATSSSVTALLLFAVPGVFLNNLTGVALNSVRSERSVMFTTIGAFLVNIAANLMFIPAAGIMGAAAATIVTEYGLLLSQCVVLLRSPKFRTGRGLPSGTAEGGS